MRALISFTTSSAMIESRSFSSIEFSAFAASPIDIEQ